MENNTQNNKFTSKMIIFTILGFIVVGVLGYAIGFKNNIEPSEDVSLPIVETATTSLATEQEEFELPVQDAQTVAITTTGNKAKLTLILDSEPNHAQDFNFEVRGISSEPGVSTYVQNFTLDDDETSAVQNIKSLDLIPGTYSISKTEPAGWASSWTCTPGFEGHADLGDGNSHTLDISAGKSITCVYNSILVS